MAMALSWEGCPVTSSDEEDDDVMDGGGVNRNDLEADTDINGNVDLSTGGFQVRQYQVDLIEVAIRENVILCLPTGCGKTFIALKVAEQMLRDNAKTGKVVVFLASKKPLIHQQAKFFETHLPSSCSVFTLTGDMGTDFYNKQEWIKIMADCNVLVMTDEILKKALYSAYITWDQICFLVLDECHHAIGNSPMAMVRTDTPTGQVMKHYKTRLAGGFEVPRVLGLTASIANKGNVSVASIGKDIDNLQNLLCSRALTHPNLQAILRYSTSAKVQLQRLAPPTYRETHRLLEHLHEARRLCDVQKALLGSGRGTVANPAAHLNPFTQIPSPLHKKKKESCEDAQKVLVDLIEIFTELGPYCAAQAETRQTERIIKIIADYKEKLCPRGDPEDRILLSLEAIYSSLVVFFRRVDDFMENAYAKDIHNPEQARKYKNKEEYKLRNFISEKVIKVLVILHSKSEECLTEDEKPLCGLVFCKRRLTTKYLSAYLKDVSIHWPLFNFLKVEYILGCASRPDSMVESRSMSSWQTEVLERFRAKELNLIVATSVVEEGVDVPSCNLVIRFDAVENYTSYVQSMGRARMRDALFYVLVPEEKYQSELQKLSNFQAFNQSLSQTLARKLQSVDDGDFEIGEPEEPMIPTFCPGGKVDSPSLSETDVIPAVYRYCTLMGSDGLSVPYPAYYIDEVNDGFMGSLRLPNCSPIRDVLEGDVMPCKKLAKRSVFRKACEALYKAGELNEYLLPRRQDENFDNSFLAELAEAHGKRKKSDRNTEQRKNKDFYTKYMPLQALGKPLADKDAVLYLYKLELDFAPSTRAIPNPFEYEFNQHPYRFGFITRSKLPELPVFRLYVSTGAVVVSVIKITERFSLNHDKFKLLMSFQKFLNEFVYLVPKTGTLEEITDTTLLIVPIQTNTNGIAWTKLKELETFKLEAFSKPPEREDRKKFQFNSNSYKDAVVVPGYRKLQTDDPNMFWVSEVSPTMTSQTPFKSSKYCGTYAGYYAKKWGFHILNPELPLIHCRVVANPRNLLQFNNKQGQSTNARDFPPEALNISPIPACFLIQGKFILSCIHRINRLMVASSIKRDVAELYKGKIMGNYNNKENVANLKPRSWAEPAIANLVEEFKRKTVIDRPVLVAAGGPLNRNTSIRNRADAMQMDRTLSPLRPTGYHYHSALNRSQKQLPQRESNINVTEGLLNIKDIKFRFASSFDTKPDFNQIREPCTTRIMEAITHADAHDSTNLERLEVMGDSVLKLVVTIHIFSNFPKWKEGRMTFVRSLLICNNNLYTLANKRNIGGILAGGMILQEKWTPPGSVIPEEENMWEVHNKHLADATEALIGAYYLAGGIDSAMQLMRWMGLEGPVDSDNELSRPFSRACSFICPDDFNYSPGDQTPRDLSPFLDELETIISYNFKNKWILIEALTHSTFLRNRVTQNYQRLEFLGDAILDFLITDYIIREAEIEDPGQVTDLRSALVNNVTFGCLSTRFHFHRFLLHQSEQLQNKIDSFSEIYGKSNYEITDPYLFLTNEDTQLPQNVDIPKALGDIFEAIVGAIYVDSGFKLDPVWKVAYRLMKQEIDTFSQVIPINPVRKLNEKYNNRVRTREMPHADSHSNLKCVEITIDGTDIKAKGVGMRLKYAKEAAAKFILKHF